MAFSSTGDGQSELAKELQVSSSAVHFSGEPLAAPGLRMIRWSQSKPPWTASVGYPIINNGCLDGWKSNQRSQVASGARVATWELGRRRRGETEPGSQPPGDLLDRLVHLGHTAGT